MFRAVSAAAILCALGCLGLVVGRPVAARPAFAVIAGTSEPERATESPAAPLVPAPAAVVPTRADPEAERRSWLTGSTQSFSQKVAHAPESLGSLSFGRANRGALFNAGRMPEGPLWHLEEPDRAFGTAETLHGIAHAVERVNEVLPATPPLSIGHISRRGGGWLRPHRSHQSGRDADIGFYYLDGGRWYARATEKNLDRPRTWLLLSTLLRETDVELVFVDRTVQRLLLDHARAVGEDAAWLDATFEGDRRGTQCTVRHEWGHATHLHVRFASEVSIGLGRRAYAALAKKGLVPRGRYD